MLVRRVWPGRPTFNASLSDFEQARQEMLRLFDSMANESPTSPSGVFPPLNVGQDEDNVFVRWVFTAPRASGDTAALDAADAFCAGVSQDIPIWENKIYRDPPVVTKTEKLILEHRRWCQQFYSQAPG